MQEDRFTIKSGEAVAAASKLASEHQNTEIAPAHLLLALLDQPEGLVSPVLTQLGSDPNSVRAAASKAIDDLPRVTGEGVPQSRPSDTLIWVIQEAEREAEAMADEYISTEHLLLGTERSKSTGVT